MRPDIVEAVKEFVDENAGDSRGIMVFMTTNEGNIRFVQFDMSSFEKIGIAKWIENVSWQLLTTRPIVEEVTEPVMSGYVQ